MGQSATLSPPTTCNCLAFGLCGSKTRRAKHKALVWHRVSPSIAAQVLMIQNMIEVPRLRHYGYKLTGAEAGTEHMPGTSALSRNPPVSYHYTRAMNYQGVDKSRSHLHYEV